MESFFLNFKFVCEILGENWKMLKRIARREYWSKCNVLYYINAIVLKSSRSKWNFFFKNFGSIFRINYIFYKSKWRWVYACLEGEAFVLIWTRSNLNPIFWYFCNTCLFLKFIFIHQESYSSKLLFVFA